MMAGHYCSLAVALLFNLRVASFTLEVTTTTMNKYCFQSSERIGSRPSYSRLQSTKSGGDEDWYSDYTPQAYVYKEKDYSSDEGGGRPYGSYETGGGGGRGGGGRGRGGGRGGDRGARGGDGRFGGGRGNSAYERDTSEDNSQVNVDAVERLIGDRTSARRASDFDAADQIRDELLNVHGVQVWDKERVWRTGCSASGSGSRRPSGGDFDRRDGGRDFDRRGSGGRDFGGRGSSGRDGGRRQRPPKDFGPTGHDYIMSPDAGSIAIDFTEAEIDELIAARLQAKMSRNFDLADRLQSELTDAGVYVHDGMKEWRADGIMFGDYANGDRPGRERGSRKSQQEEPFAQSAYSTGLDSLTDEDITKIEGMVSRRAGAKLSRNYRTADGIRDELKDLFNVFVDDRLKQWSVGGDFGPDSPGNQDKKRPWNMSVYSESVTDEALIPEIEAELERRNEAKMVRDFDLADDIRQSLLDEFNVAVDDRLREWSIGGDFGLKPKNRDGPYSRRGGGELTFEEEEEIVDMVEVRARAKKNRDFATADEMRDTLEAKYSVKVDDQSREWRVMSDDYILTRNDNRLADSLDDEDIGFIQKRLKERLALKSNRMYDAADEIRDELKSRYGVSIDDRTREWSVEVNQFTVVDSTAPRDFTEQQQSNSRAESYNGYETIDNDFEFTDAVNEALQDSNSSDGIAVNAESLSSFTVPELKEKLKAAGLPVSGKKADLIDRLLGA